MEQVDLVGQKGTVDEVVYDVFKTHFGVAEAASVKRLIDSLKLPNNKRGLESVEQSAMTGKMSNFAVGRCVYALHYSARPAHCR
jgi:hypothetical protein